MTNARAKYGLSSWRALEKYKNLESKGDWLKKTDDELEFIALQSQIKELKQNPTTTKGKTPGTGKGKGKEGKDTRNTGIYAWKGVAPKAGESHEKTVGGKKYIYCPHHGATKWVLKVNQQGIEHKTGCLKMAAAIAGRIETPAAPTGEDRIHAALANVEVEDDEESIP